MLYGLCLLYFRWHEYIWSSNVVISNNWSTVYLWVRSTLGFMWYHLCVLVWVGLFCPVSHLSWAVTFHVVRYGFAQRLFCCAFFARKCWVLFYLRRVVFCSLEAAQGAALACRVGAMGPRCNLRWPSSQYQRRCVTLKLVDCAASLCLTFCFTSLFCSFANVLIVLLCAGGIVTVCAFHAAVGALVASNACSCSRVLYSENGTFKVGC